MNEMTQTEVAETTAETTTKRERKIDANLDLDQMVVTFTVKGISPPIDVRVADYPEDVVRHATLHGFNQKLRDACAGMTDTREIHAIITELAETLKNGWSVRIPGQDKDESLLSKAIALYISNKYLDLDQAAAAYAKAADPEIRKRLASTVEIKALKARLQAERATGRSAEDIL